MTKPAHRARYLLTAASALAVMTAPCVTLANTSGPYLNWRSKTPQATPAPAEMVPETPEVHTSTGAYAVPPSPYGQVGDPYGGRLRWPAKQMSAPAVASITPPPQTSFAPMPAAPVHNPPPVSMSRSMPMSAPRPVAVVPLPAPQPERDDPGLADDPGMADDPSMADDAPAPATERPVTPRKAAPVVASAPLRTPTDTMPAAVPPAVTNALTTDGAYQVPTTSKYAARIAAARAASLPTAETPKTSQTAPKSTATAPEPQVSLASQETDHVFIPGEHYTSSADEPRVYSLHRQYGMRPDPITVTPGANGALLTVSPDMVEGGDPNDDDKKSDTDKN